MPSNPRSKRMASRFSDQDFDTLDGASSSKDGSLFVWTIIILLLIAFAIACWIGSFYIFGHPETPFSYQILNKLKKIDPPKRFEFTDAPRGEFLKPAQILDRYGKLSPRELMRVNEALLRNYLRNYKLTQDLVPYVVGTYNILDSYELAKDNFFDSGVVALAQAKETPKVLLEQIFPTQAKIIPALQRTLLTGLDIDFKRENELCAILHVDKTSDGRVKVTAISILYPSYESATASGTIALEPPQVMNVAAGLPVLTAGRVTEADAKYASYRRKAGLPALSPEAPSQTRLMRVERPVAMNTPSPAAQASPVPAQALPVVPAATPSAVAAIPTPTPVPSPAEATPTPSPSPSPTAAVLPSSDSWPIYEPGRMPRGRLLNVKDVSSKAGGDMTGERTYLQGNFLVTASGPNRAVLRTQGAITEAIGFGGRSSNVRVIVEFPPGSHPPAEGATFSRDARRPFQITDVREGADGQVNVYVREVTRP